MAFSNIRRHHLVAVGGHRLRRDVGLVGHHEGVAHVEPALEPAPRKPSSPGLEAQAAVWIDDLYWHRKMYQQSRYRWFPEDPINLVTALTGGRLDFRTVGDVEFLQEMVLDAGDDASVVSNAFASKLEQTLPIILDLEEIAELLGMTYVECSTAVWFYERADCRKADSLNIRRVLEFVPFRNPLIEAWELKQLLRLYESAQEILEDALCDLLEELLPSRDPLRLAFLAGNYSVAGVRRRIAAAREARGLPEDPRRVRHQVF